MNNRCLMIEMQDHRRFFTAKDNLNNLLEFARTFNVRVSLVTTQNAKCLNIEELPEAICDGTYHCPGSYSNQELILPRETIFTATRPRTRPRRATLALARLIRGFVRTALTARQTISLAMLRDKYQEHDLGTSCLSMHLNRVRREMIGEGYRVDKLGPGCYRLSED